jgi:ABC-type Mn2+/Zn2+ transport system permease subunit
VISEFIESWDLFAESYLLGISLAIMLPLIGVMVVMRRQVFVSVAISQTSILGMAFGLLIQSEAHHHESSFEGTQLVIVLIFSLLASILCLRIPVQSADRREVSTVMVFILSTTLAYLILAKAPVGLQEIQERMSSSLISSSMIEVEMVLGISMLLALFWAYHKNRIILVSVDPETARTQGLPILAWDLLLSVIIGLLIGWSVYLCGWLFTFGNLIFPIYIVRRFAQSITQVLVLAPLLAIGLNFLGYFLAHPFDIPFTQMAVAVLGGAYLITPRWNRR